MYFSRIFIIASLLFTNVLVAPAAAQQQENIVLLPIEVSPEYANQENLIGVALQQSLSKNFNVFYGDSVEAALQAEYAKEDCSAEACVQNIAILFNGEIVVDASLQLVEKSTFLSVQFRNVITGELEAVVQDSCDNCSFTELVKFIDRRTNNVQLKSSEGLAALVKEPPEPEERLVKRDPVQVPKKDVVLPQQTERQKPTKVASPSYWKWGLGALVLGAAGGGGGGGGGDSGSRGSGQNFSSWSEIAPNKTLNLTGMSLNREYTAPAPNYTVTEISPLNTEDSTLSISYDSQPDVASIQLTTGSKSQTFSTSAGDFFGTLGEIFGPKWDKISFAVDQAGQDFGIALNAVYPGVDWSYQTYGAWFTGGGTGSGYIASTSVGNQTFSSSIPASGTAVFNGFSSGFALTIDGERSIIVSSDFQATADFASREVLFAASNSEAAFLDTLENNIDGRAYDYSGTLTYNSGTNSLVGSLNTSEGINSTVTAQFYGPNAEELGGVFEVSSPNDVGTYSGSFGAKR